MKSLVVWSSPHSTCLSGRKHVGLQLVESWTDQSEESLGVGLIVIQANKLDAALNLLLFYNLIYIYRPTRIYAAFHKVGKVEFVV
jgi:hypothetical protein